MAYSAATESVTCPATREAHKPSIATKRTWIRVAANVSMPELTPLTLLIHSGSHGQARFRRNYASTERRIHKPSFLSVM